MAYTVIIKHPKPGNTVTVRERAEITGYWKGVLFDGETITADLEFRPNGDVWATIIVDNAHPANEGYYAAVRYAGKTFAIWNEIVPPPDPDETTGEYYYVKEDWFTSRWNHQPRPVAPDPGVFPLSSTKDNWPQTDFCRLPEKWQWFWIDLLAMKKYGKLYSQLLRDQQAFIVGAFTRTTKSDRAFNNLAGTDIYNCYPCRITNRGEDPKQESLVCCGNDILILKKEPNRAGRLMGLVYSFDVNENPPPVTPQLLNDPRIFWAKVVNPGMWLTNFTFLGPGIEVPVPLLTKGLHWYPMDELRKLE